MAAADNSLQRFAVLGADTWLHVTTSTVPYDVLTPVVKPTSSFGRRMAEWCLQSPYQGYGGCALSADGPTTWFKNGSEVIRTVHNLSSTNLIASTELNGRTFTYFTDARRTSSVDFQASTFAMHTQCKPISKSCGLKPIFYCAASMNTGCVSAEMYSEGMRFNCSESLYGDIDNSTGSAYAPLTPSSNIGLFLQMFTGPQYEGPIHQGDTIPNPFYFATGAQVTASQLLASDQEIVQDQTHNDTAILLSCKSTVYEFTYAYVNGSVIGGSYHVSNGTLSSNIGAPMNWPPYYAQDSMETTFVTGAQQSNTSQQFADYFAQGFGQTALSMLAAVLTPAPTLLEQTRETLLVAKVAKVPFFTLIGLNLLYAILGLTLAFIAFSSHPRTTRDVQARLSVAGLVAALLEADHVPSPGNGLESLFAEHAGHDESRVGIEESGNGRWQFRTILRPAALEKSARDAEEDGSSITASSLLLQVPRRVSAPGEQNEED